MRPELIEILRCPDTGHPLRLEISEQSDGRVRSGALVSEATGVAYPVRDFIPRFVPSENYADSFGMQWNAFRRTQLDSYSGHPISADRFWRATKWTPEELRGKWVLDAGCGAGRFAEVALEAGAKVVALDFSDAVDACYANLRHFSDLHLLQGDIYHLPLHNGFFDFIYCLGVLQHTPSPEKAFGKLPRLMNDGGRLAIDVYEKNLVHMALQPKYWLRPISKRISKERLFRLMSVCVPPLFKMSCLMRRVPTVGSSLSRLIPVANYTGVYDLPGDEQLAWSILDTFDWYSPEYDRPQEPQALQNWLERAGLLDIEIERAGHLVGRGKTAS